MRKKPTVISTFAGCDGSSLGYRMAGFKELLAVEWDPHACASFRLNFPDVQVWEGDIHDLTAEEAMRLAGIGPGELDVLDGSPPCQGFSTSGKRREDDSRNVLTREYARLVDGIRPKAFVMENVIGLVKGKMAKFYLEFVAQLRAAGPGYRVAGAVLNCAHFGVPQRRERVIVIGFRSDLGIEPTFPAPTATRMVTASEAIAGVGGPEHDAERAWMLEYCARFTREKPGAWGEWDMVRPGKNLERERNTPGHAFGSIKAHPHRPMFTVPKNDGTIGFHGSMHWAERRRFTTAEYRRFFGYPEDFKFPIVEGTAKVSTVAKTWAAAVSRMGNSVPPLLMAAVSKHVLLCLNNRTEPKRRTDGPTDKGRKKRAHGAHQGKRPQARDRARG